MDEVQLGCIIMTIMISIEEARKKYRETRQESEEKNERKQSVNGTTITLKSKL